MNFYPLVQKLVQIERSIDVVGPTEIRTMVIDAEESAVQLQKEVVEILGAERGAFFRPLAESDAGAAELLPPKAV